MEPIVAITTKITKTSQAVKSTAHCTRRHTAMGKSIAHTVLITKSIIRLNQAVKSIALSTRQRTKMEKNITAIIKTIVRCFWHHNWNYAGNRLLNLSLPSLVRIVVTIPRKIWGEKLPFGISNLYYQIPSWTAGFIAMYSKSPQSVTRYQKQCCSKRQNYIPHIICPSQNI